MLDTRVNLRRDEGERMSGNSRPVIGAIVHFDLTVDDAPAVRDF